MSYDSLVSCRPANSNFMASQQTWPPYGNLKDCTQGFCSIYCPQWCYIVFPPPPPAGYSSEDSSGSNFSPLVIAIIGILASAFILVCYYTIASRHCRRADPLRRRGGEVEEFDGNRDPGGHDVWRIATRGLDEAVVKSIAVCKYKKGDGLVDGTDCSVCLSEFREDESLRLLPKCSHAFHVPCIDTWLKSHSNCPLCRANIVPPAPLPAPPPVRQENPPDHRPAAGGTIASIADLLERGGEEEDEISIRRAESKSHGRALSNLEDGIRLVELREVAIQPIRRSVSMDSLCQGRLLIADVLETNMEDGFSGEAGSSQTCRGENSRFSINHRSRTLHCVKSPVAMKRSSSSSTSLSGRFTFAARSSRGRSSILPV